MRGTGDRKLHRERVPTRGDRTRAMAEVHGGPSMPSRRTHPHSEAAKRTPLTTPARTRHTSHRAGSERVDGPGRAVTVRRVRWLLGAIVQARFVVSASAHRVHETVPDPSDEWRVGGGGGATTQIAHGQARGTTVCNCHIPRTGSPRAPPGVTVPNPRGIVVGVSVNGTLAPADESGAGADSAGSGTRERPGDMAATEETHTSSPAPARVSGVAFVWTSARPASGLRGTETQMDARSDGRG